MKILFTLWSWLRWIRELPYILMAIFILICLWYIPPVAIALGIICSFAFIVGYGDFGKYCANNDPKDNIHQEAIFMPIIGTILAIITLSYYYRADTLMADWPNATFPAGLGLAVSSFMFFSFAFLAIDAVFLAYKKKQEEE